MKNYYRLRKLKKYSNYTSTAFFQKLVDKQIRYARPEATDVSCLLRVVDDIEAVVVVIQVHNKIDGRDYAISKSIGYPQIKYKRSVKVIDLFVHTCLLMAKELERAMEFKYNNV